MKKITNPRIWEFDVDDTLIMWDRSAAPLDQTRLVIEEPIENRTIDLYPNIKNINLLKKLSKIGWYIRVHSGSGVEWAEKIVTHLHLNDFVDEVCAKPLGRTDDQKPGDGIVYDVYRK